MKILIVEDEFVSRVKLQKLLSKYGECHQAVSAAEAFEAFLKAQEMGAPYDLATIDMNLPDGKGIDIVQKIRTWEKENWEKGLSKEIKILVITVVTDSKSIVTSFRQGVEGYITKPFSPEKIAEEMARAGILED